MAKQSNAKSSQPTPRGEAPRPNAGYPSTTGKVSGGGRVNDAPKPKVTVA